ncbi:chlorophyllase [Aeromicrobium sp. CFBP 8757]|uniref:alpha/beta hydrolase family protein n=1 Tax=Aeromicrobium sp. CFBP 8757 TaxID=2775288 RepID=UPI00177F6A15|nr:chlorophyllase [Aeromicrobium sp. CFBP 8757]MBD8608309.1 chlorophyllase [Aeromicrobium sp. CFBP 8757]
MSSIVHRLDALTGPSIPVVSVAPVVLEAPGRSRDLHVRVSAPVTGTDLPIVLFSHGNGWSHDGYAPLTAFWASRGFVVVQPTHLDSRRLGTRMDDPGFADIWRTRVADLRRVLDQLDTVESAVPGLARRVDRSRIAAAGHSWGAQSVGELLGARVLDADGTPGDDLSEARVTAGVLLATAGTGDDLSPWASTHLPFMRPSFASLATPTLVVAGDRDDSPLTTRGPEWMTDAYELSPGATDLLTLFGGEHSLGGIPGHEVAETTDEDPERVAVVQRLTTAYLRSALDPSDPCWTAARDEFNAAVEPGGRIDSRT